MKDPKRQPMRNLKELNAILTAIHCINFISEPRNNEIFKLTDYAFRRIFGCNSNLKSMFCMGYTKEQVMSMLMKLLEDDTKYLDYLKEYHTKNETQE